MAFNIELTCEELRALSIELEFLVDEYTKNATNAHRVGSETEGYWRSSADTIKSILEKITSASHTA